MQEYLVFRIGPERFAIALDAVREIRRPPRVTPLPESPVWLRGVTNLRGVILAVIDIAVGLGARTEVSEPKGRKCRLVVMRDVDCDAGFCVDAVDGVVTVDEADLMTPPDTLPELLRRWCEGIAALEAGLVVMLSPEFLSGLQERLGMAK